MLRRELAFIPQASPGYLHSFGLTRRYVVMLTQPYNLLKPALARGGLRAIGATTWSEYKKHIEKDPALTRRFQVLQVMEPQEAEAIAMVRGLVPAFAKHHGVTILDEAVRAAVTLSHRYIPARQLPDKAISLLDTACARVAMSLHAPSRELEDVQSRLAALQGECLLLQQEADMGKDRKAVLADLHERIAELERQQDAHTKTGAQVRALTSAILTKREAAQQAQDVETQLEVVHELQLLEQELAAIQGDSPSIHVEVGEGVIATIVADWTGIPVGRMVRDDIAARNR